VTLAYLRTRKPSGSLKVNVSFAAKRIGMRIGISIVNYNNWEDTLECVQSILDSKEQLDTILIIDNKSTNDSLFELKKWILTQPGGVLIKGENELNHANKARLQLVPALFNRGYAGANNIAMRYFFTVMNVDAVWILNNDTVLDKGCIGTLTAYLQNTNKAGLVGMKLVRYEDPTRLQATGAIYNKWIGRTIQLNEDAHVSAPVRMNQPGDFVIGASVAVTKTFYEKVGGMNEEYFLYGEEIDWAERARRAGFSLATCSSCHVFHKESASIKGKRKKGSEFSDYYYVRSRILVAMNLFPYTLPSIYLSTVYIIILRLLRGEKEKARLLLKVLMTNPERLRTMSFQEFTTKA
jgi:GT2 family glycosyltransferase